MKLASRALSDAIEAIHFDQEVLKLVFEEGWDGFIRFRQRAVDWLLVIFWLANECFCWDSSWV